MRAADSARVVHLCACSQARIFAHKWPTHALRLTQALCEKGASSEVRDNTHASCHSCSFTTFMASKRSLYLHSMWVLGMGSRRTLNNYR